MTSDLIPIWLPIIWVIMGIPGFFMIRNNALRWTWLDAIWTACVCALFGPVPTLIEFTCFCITRLP